MKKASRIIISILLIATMIVPAAIFANAEVNVSTTPIKSENTSEYYNLKEGLYTKKTIAGPDADGNYDVTIDAYTSDVRYIQKNVKALDILVLLDNSGSMGTNLNDKASRAYQARDAIVRMIKALRDTYGAGNKFQANIAICPFAGDDTAVWKYGYQAIPRAPTKEDTQQTKDTLNNAYESLCGAEGKGGKIYTIDTSNGDTPTDKALAVAQSVTQDRKSKTGNQQVVLLVTDGHPSYKATGSASVTFDKWKWENAIRTHKEESGEYIESTETANIANRAIATAEEIKSYADIYTFGVAGGYEDAAYEQNDNTLATIVTDGYATAKGTGTRDNVFSSNWTIQREIQLGPSSIWVRRGATFMNIVSSGWKATGAVKSYHWGVADNARVYNENKTGDYYNPKKGLRKEELYKNWATKNKDGTWSWQNIPSDYTRNINKNNPGATYYFAGGIDRLAKALSDSVAYTLSTHYVSQGSLLGDFSIKSTMSDYFEIIPNSWNTYKIPYDSETGAYQADTNKTQYGEGDRAWGTPTSVSMVVETTTGSDGTLNSISLPANKDNASVKDSFIIKDDTALLEATHSGNKLRLTFKVRPKDSFMGGKGVPVDNYNKSGIFQTVDGEEKAIQQFKNLTLKNGVESFNADASRVQVGLVNATAKIDADNVKIGYLYKLDDLGQKNLRFTYTGRYSGDTYSMKHSEDGYSVYNSLNQEVIYSDTEKADADKAAVDTKPNDFVDIVFGAVRTDSNTYGLVSNSQYAQFNSTGITRSGNTYSKKTPTINKYVYLLWKGMDAQKTLLDERFPDYNKTGKDSKASSLDGIVDGNHYYYGYTSIRQFDVLININVYVPIVKVSDAVVNSNKTYPVDSYTLSSAIDNYTIQNADDENTKNLINDQTLSSLVFAQADTSSNSEFVLVDIGDNGLPKAVSSNTSFVNDAFSINEAVNIKGYLKAFADSDGNAKVSGDAITDKDQLRFAISYVELNDKLNALNKDAPFKLTVDEFWATNECDVCKAEEKYVPQYLGYQAQVHKMITTDNITVRKTGCNASHTNGSFVFTVIGMNEKDGKPDLDSMKILNNFTIQGNGQRTISVNTSAYKYFCVVEDLNALVIKEQEGTKNAELIKSGWTWDYTKNVTVNGTKWESIIKNAFTMDGGDGYSLTFNNEYNPNNSTLHYASAYATNTMSHDKVEVTTSPSNTTK